MTHRLSKTEDKKQLCDHTGHNILVEAVGLLPPHPDHAGMIRQMVGMAEMNNSTNLITTVAGKHQEPSTWLLFSYRENRHLFLPLSLTTLSLAQSTYIYISLSPYSPSLCLSLYLSQTLSLSLIPAYHHMNTRLIVKMFLINIFKSQI